jgi:hypothetical protein
MTMPNWRVRQRPHLLAVLAVGTAVYVASPTFHSTAAAHPVNTQTQKASSRATAAQHQSLKETIQSRLVSHHATLLTERGTGKGTFNCNINLEIRLSYTHAYITFSAYPPGGSLLGHGETSFYVAGSSAKFNGTLILSGGSGKYSHASGSALTLQGTLQRGTYALSATVNGTMNL